MILYNAFYFFFFWGVWLQPLIVNALGPAANVSASVAQTMERPDRIPPAVSISSLVSLAS